MVPKGGRRLHLVSVMPSLASSEAKAEVAHLGDGPATGQGEAVDGGDHGLPGLRPHVGPVGTHAVGGAGLNAFGVVLGALLEVAAGAEGPPSAGDDGDKGLGVAVELGDGVGKLATELSVDGVQVVRAVEGDDYDVIPLFVKDCFSQIGMLPR